MQQERRSRLLAPILPFVSLPLTREFSSNKHFQQLAGIHHVYKARKYHTELLVQLLTALKAQGQNRNDWSWMCIPQSVQRVIQAISPLTVLTPHSHIQQDLILSFLIFSISTLSMGSSPHPIYILKLLSPYKNIKPCSFYCSLPFSIKILKCLFIFLFKFQSRH